MKNWYKTSITVREIINSTSPNDRIIMSKQGDYNFVDYSGSQRISMKPKGLWYAVGNDWLQFVAREFGGGFGPHLFKIDINPSAMIMIHDHDSFIRFANEYGIKDDPLAIFMNRVETIMNIDWIRVASDYSGIEISPYMGRFRLSNHMWYYGWDVASGCIWREDAINDYEFLYRNIEPLSKKDHSEYKDDVKDKKEVEEVNEDI